MISKEIDLLECGQFFDAFYVTIDSVILGKGTAYNPPGGLTNGSNSVDLEGLYAPFQSYKAEETYRKYQVHLDKFVTDWNNNPGNRSKVG